MAQAAAMIGESLVLRGTEGGGLHEQQNTQQRADLENAQSVPGAYHLATL